MLQALPEPPLLTELRAGLARLLLQGPSSRAQSCSRERKISTDSRPALDGLEVMGLSKGPSLQLHLPWDLCLGGPLGPSAQTMRDRKGAVSRTLALNDEARQSSNDNPSS